MDSKVDIWMPLAIGDYLADTSHLNTTQHGAYLLLLMHYWRKGPLPNDPEQLANITKLSMDAWSINQAVLMQFFVVGEDSLLHQKRSDRERKVWMDKRAKAQDKASKAAKARWKDASSITSSNAQSNAQAMLNSCPLPLPLPLPLPSPLPIPKPLLPEFAKNANSSSSADALDNCLESEFSFDEPIQPNLTREVVLQNVYQHYLKQTGRKASMYALTSLRKQKACARMDEALAGLADGSLEKAQLLMMAAIDELVNDDWHMGRNPKTGGKKFIEWETHLFGSREIFEKWIRSAAEGN
jgi:uncharacterized protein YdaU (DUF1376 family)